MGLRTRAILLGVAFFLVSPLSFALGLGEIKLNSHLNQPLEAEIQLLQTRELSAQEILVGLASREDFERVGVDRPFFLSDLKFTVEMDAPNGPVIRVKSTRLVREPFLNFIIQTQWPSGKLLREYTVLLDLPAFSNKPVRAVQAPKAQERAASRPSPSATPAAPARQPAGTFDGDTYGPVRSSDTLWAIAESARPSGDVSVHQTMLAIQRLNPDAFINSNINLLKKGAVLRLPSESEISQLDMRAARNDVEAQNRSVRSEVPDAQIDASRNVVERTAEAEPVQGRVKLSSSTDTTGSRSGSGSGEGEQNVDSLRTQLLSTQEELASTQRENADLNERVLTMDEQVQTMERLLEVANTDLRKLELALEEQANQAEERATEALEAEATSLEDQTASDEFTETEALVDTEEFIETEHTTETDSAEDASQIETTPAEASIDSSIEESIVEPEAVEPPAVEAPKAAPKPTPAPFTKKKSLLDILMENILYVGGALVLLIAGVVYFLLTRSSRIDEDDFDFDDADDEDPIASASEELEDLAPDSAEQEISLEEDDFSSDDDITLESLETELLAGTSPLAPSPLEQADEKIAHGEYEQALAILSDAGDDAEVQLKRLEVFAKQDNLTAFDEQYALFEHGASFEQTQKAQDFRGLISSAVLGSTVAALDQEAEPDYDELDTTLKFDTVTQEDIDTAADDTVLTADFTPEPARADDDVTLLDLGDNEAVSLDDVADNLDIELEDDLELELDLSGDLDGEIDLSKNLADVDLEASDSFEVTTDSEVTGSETIDSLDATESLESESGLDVIEGFEASTESISEDLEFDLGDSEIGQPATSEESTVEQKADNDELSLDLDENFSLEDVDIELGADLDIDVAEPLSTETSATETDDVVEPGAPAFELDTEIRDSQQIQEDSDELDLTNLEFSENVSQELNDLELSLDDDFSLGDDLDFPQSDPASEPEQKADTAELSEAINAETINAESLEVDLELLDKDLDELSTSFDGDLTALDNDIDLAVETDVDDSPVVEPEALTSVVEEPLVADLAEQIEPLAQLDPLSEQPESPTSEADIDAEDDGSAVELPAFDPDSDDDSEPGFLGDSDEVATKIDLLRVFVDMGDTESALNTLGEIREEGNGDQKKEAEELFASLG